MVFINTHIPPPTRLYSAAHIPRGAPWPCLVLKEAHLRTHPNATIRPHRLRLLLRCRREENPPVMGREVHHGRPYGRIYLEFTENRVARAEDRERRIRNDHLPNQTRRAS